MRMWCGFDVEELQKALPHASTPSELLPQLIIRYKLDKHQDKQELLTIWEQHISAEIAAHAHPLNIRNNTLFIQVESPAWLSEIVRFHRKDILQQMQTCMGADKVKKLSFRL